MFRVLSSKLSEIRNSLSKCGGNWGQNVILKNISNPNEFECKRSVVYYNQGNGKFRSNKAVLQRFYRLNWGAWIRCRAGRHKHLWRKPYHIRWWAKQHVFCTDEQNKVLDQMVDAYYKTPTYFVDDPYEPYQKRHNFAFVPLGRTHVGTSYINTLYDYKPND